MTIKLFFLFTVEKKQKNKKRRRDFKSEFSWIHLEKLQSGWFPAELNIAGPIAVLRGGKKAGATA